MKKALILAILALTSSLTAQTPTTPPAKVIKMLEITQMNSPAPAWSLPGIETKRQDTLKKEDVLNNDVFLIQKVFITKIDPDAIKLLIKSKNKHLIFEHCFPKNNIIRQALGDFSKMPISTQDDPKYLKNKTSLETEFSPATSTDCAIFRTNDMALNAAGMKDFIFKKEAADAIKKYLEQIKPAQR